jgi:hypothetical protein
MKIRIIPLLLMAVVSLPSMAQSFKVKTRVNTNDERGAVTLVQKAFPVKGSKSSKKVKAKVDIPEGYVSVTLTADDVWGDGSGYQMLLDADATAYGTIIPETGALSGDGDVDASIYAEFEYKIPENADGALTTTNILIDNSVTILIPAGTYDWCITNPTPGDRLWIASGNGSVGGRYDDFVFYEGLSYEFHVIVSGSNDGVDLEISGIVFSYDVDNITSNSADAKWTLDGSASSVNLRYRKVNNSGFFADFEDYEHLSDDGWWVYDYDEDGNTWGLTQDEEFAHSGSIFFYSASYDNGQSYDPDNWLVTPKMDMSGKTLSFWARSYYSNYLDNFGVFFLPEDFESEEDLIELMESTTAPEEWTEYTINLPDNLGVGSIVFRHYNSYDNYYLFLDDVFFGEPFDPAEYAWVEVNGLTGSSYTMSDLEPGTEYEMQMQAYPMDWGKRIFFTTAIELANDGTENSDIISANDGKTVDVKLAGRTLFKDDKWNTICLPFNVTLAGSPLEGATAKTLTGAVMTGTHVTLTFGDAVDELEAGVPYIIKWDAAEENIVEPVFSGVTISQLEGQTLSFEDENVKFIGYYDAFTANDESIYYMTADNTLKYSDQPRTLKSCRAYFQFTEASTGRQIILNFGGGETTGIADLDMNETTGDWYTVDGKMLDKQPARKGMYIKDGVKVVIK